MDQLLQQQLIQLKAEADNALKAWQSDLHEGKDGEKAWKLYGVLQDRYMGLASKVPVIGGGSVVAGHAAAPKAVLIDKGDGQPPVKKRFKSPFQYDKYLSNKGAECLRKVGCNPPEDGDVDDIENLVDDEVYELILKDKPLAIKVDEHEQHQQHMIHRREEEFFEALTPIVAAEEGVAIGDVVKLPQLREIYAEDGKTREVELDAVLRVDNGRNGPVMYVGSTKTYCNGDGDPKALVGTIKGIKVTSKMPEAPSGYHAFCGYKIRGAFMAEYLGPVGAKRVPLYCHRTGLLHLKRSSGSIIRARLALIPTRARLVGLAGG